MDIFQAVVLGLVEGLTEFIPVSSTGHLILARDLMGLKGKGVDAYLVIIQSGALCAALVYYFSIWKRLLGFVRPDGGGQRGLLFSLILAAAPAALLGVFLEKKIDAVLFGMIPVSVGLMVGGLVMIFSVFLRRPPRVLELEHVGWRRALVVGFCQCFSLWPGMSRSMTTILGGRLAGLDLKVATDFSFLLSIPILAGASVYKMISHRQEMSLLIQGSPVAVGVGWLVACVVGLLAIFVFIRSLKSFGLLPYGIYRVLLGAGIFVFLFVKG